MATLRNVKRLYAVEINLMYESDVDNYWVILSEVDNSLCIYPTFKEAKKSAQNRDHQTRVVKYMRTR